MFGATWWEGRRRRAWSGDMRGARVNHQEAVEAPQSSDRAVSIEVERPGGVSPRVEISLGPEEAVLSWRIHLHNRSAAPIKLDRVEMLRLRDSARGYAAPAVSPKLRFQTGPEELAFYSNGWESWNASGVLGRRDSFPRTRLGPLTLPMRLGALRRQPRGRSRLTSEMFGVLGDRASRRGLLLGFLSQAEAFGGLQVNLERDAPGVRMWAECDGVTLAAGETFSTDWCCLEFIHLDREEPLGNYIGRVAQLNHARIPSKTPVGWSSWYQFFQAVTEADVAANLEWAREHRGDVPLDVIQLDDGFAVEVGDWETTSAGFPSGLAAVSREIRRAGFAPGLWLAPFVAKPRARILREHPEWILRNRIGIPANAGFIWDTFTRALDITHPEVIEHVMHLVTMAVKIWGFDYLKLDFLYAGALRGRRRDPSRTRAQALRSILQQMRSAAGEGVFLVGCGCPLGSGIGIFDAMRIGPDVAPTWEPAYRGLQRWLRHEPDLPSVRNALRNSITRAALHQRWWLNDPDCVILRGGSAAPRHRRPETASDEDASARPVVRRSVSSTPSRLTEEETRTLASVVALTGGSLFVSDHLPDLPERRVELLARLLPPLAGGLRAIDWFDREHPKRLILPMRGAAGDWCLVALINWDDLPADVAINLSRISAGGPFVHAVDFWNETYLPVRGDELLAKNIAPHGTRLLALRRASTPQWLGDTLHISQGLAVSSVRAGPRVLTLDLKLRKRAAGKAWLELPSPPIQASLDGAPLGMSHVEGDIYSCGVSFDGTGRLEVEW